MLAAGFQRKKFLPFELDFIYLGCADTFYAWISVYYEAIFYVELQYTLDYKKLNQVSSAWVVMCATMVLEPKKLQNPVGKCNVSHIYPCCDQAYFTIRHSAVTLWYKIFLRIHWSMSWHTTLHWWLCTVSKAVKHFCSCNSIAVIPVKYLLSISVCFCQQYSRDLLLCRWLNQLNLCCIPIKI